MVFKLCLCFPKHACRYTGIDLDISQWLDMVANTWNTSTLGGQGKKTAGAQEFKTNLGNMARPHLYKNYKNYLSMVAWACSPSYLGG